MNQKTAPTNEIKKPPIQSGKKWIYIILSMICIVYVFFPESTDFIPFLGWIDEGIAILILSYSLKKLGVKIPLIDKLIHIKLKKRIPS